MLCIAWINSWPSQILPMNVKYLWTFVWTCAWLQRSLTLSSPAVSMLLEIKNNFLYRYPKHTSYLKFWECWEVPQLKITLGEGFNIFLNFIIGFYGKSRQDSILVQCRPKCSVYEMCPFGGFIISSIMVYLW